MVVAELLTRLGFEVDPRELNRGLNHAKSRLVEFKQFLGKLAIGYTFYKMGSYVLKTARELETLNTQLKVMTGSSERAGAIFKGVIDYAKETSFYVKDVTGSVSKLLQGMVAVPDVMPKIKQLGDIASNSDQLNHLAYAYARVNQQGYMTNREARLFNEGGQFNLMHQYALFEAERKGLMRKGEDVAKGSQTEKWILARQGELFEMARAHEFTVGMVDKALEYATTRGGIFFEHQKEQVKTFEGAWSNMWDVISINAGLAMQKMFPLFKDLMSFVTNLDMSWMGPMFERISAWVYSFWAALKGFGIQEIFQDLKTTLMEFADGVVAAFGGGSAGGATKNLAMAITILLRVGVALLREVGVPLALMFVRVTVAAIDLVSWLRKNWVVVTMLATAIVGTLSGMFGLGSSLRMLVGLVTMFTGRTGTLGTLLLWFVESPLTTLTLAFEVLFAKLGVALQTVFPSLMRFSAIGVGQFAALAMSIAFTASQVWSLWKAIRGSQEAKEDLENLTRRSELATRVGLYRQKYDAMVKGGYWSAADEAHRYLTAAEADLAAFEKEHPFKGATGENGQQTDPQLAALQASIDKLVEKAGDGNESLDKIAGNTTPRNGVPNDVLRLASMAFRTRFEIPNSIMLAAE